MHINLESLGVEDVRQEVTVKVALTVERMRFFFFVFSFFCVEMAKRRDNRSGKEVVKSICIKCLLDIVRWRSLFKCKNLPN